MFIIIICHIGIQGKYSKSEDFVVKMICCLIHNYERRTHMLSEINIPLLELSKWLSKKRNLYFDNIVLVLGDVKIPFL